MVGPGGLDVGLAGTIIVVGTRLDAETLTRARAMGVRGVIVGGFVLSAAFYDHFGPDRRFHQLAHDVAAKSPFMGLIRRYGVVPASHENARAAFELGAA